jgi:predicted ATPase
MYKSLEIVGLRGFSAARTLTPAIPNGTRWSGLTILVGPNNSGKSTIVEAFRAISKNDAVSFPEGRRNVLAGGNVRIHAQYVQGGWRTLETVAGGGSETNFTAATAAQTSTYVLPSRRYFQPFFGRHIQPRDAYLQQLGSGPFRGASIDQFATRLFDAQKNKTAFNSVLSRIISPPPNWVIEQSDAGNYYLKYEGAGFSHGSEGIGEGIISLLFIIDALYDSQPGTTIVIDEPELSLHPSYQRRLAHLLGEYAAHRQIIYSTHSPYLADMEAVTSGAQLTRVHNNGQAVEIHSLSVNTREQIKGLLKDSHNPHTLGIVARETFFLDDGIILVEGQDDVTYYPRVLDQLGIALNATFFGWGTGGAHKFEIIAALLRDLGFTKVAGILDSDKANLLPGLEAMFPAYPFIAIPAKDVRTKEPRSATPAVEGLLDENWNVRGEYKSAVESLFQDLANHFG